MAKPKVTTKSAVATTAPPQLSANEWNVSMLLGAVLVVLAALQLVSFSDFKDVLKAIGLPSPTVWATVLILAELWAAAGFFKLRLSEAFRMASSLFAVLVTGFWFYEAVRLASMSPTHAFNMGFFGHFLKQTPGWWTVVEASAVFFVTLYILSLTNKES